MRDTTGGETEVSVDYGGNWTRPLDRQESLDSPAPTFRDRAKSALRRGSYYYRVWHYAFGSWPSVFFPLCAWREGFGSPHSVRRDTEIVIEGFPRSGNTFAVHAFCVAQGRPTRIADHLHVPAQIMRAASYGIPACVLIRDPADAARSLAVKYPELSIQHALKGYIGFYSACWAYRDRFVVADFDTATKNLGLVIDAVNRRFGTRFRRFEHTPQNVDRVFAQLDRRNAAVNLGDTLASYRPNDSKEERKQRLDLSPHGALLDQARRLYRDYSRLQPRV